MHKIEKQRIYSLLMAGVLSFSLLGDIKKSDDTEAPNLNEYVTLNTYNSDEVAEIKEKDYDNLLWVNLLQKTKILTIYLEDVDSLKDIAYLPRLEKLTIINNSDDKNVILTKEACRLLKHSHNLKALRIDDYNIEPGLLEGLKTLETIYLSTNYDMITANYYFDYNEMPNLKEIMVNKPYSLLIHMDNNNIESIISRNIRIRHPNDGGFEDITKDFLDTYKKIAVMASEIPITDNDNEKVRVWKIVNYIARNYHYDKEFISSKREKGDTFRKFYKGGYLYGILKSDHIICGNYAALFSALANQYDIPSMVVMSERHAWNLLYIDDVLYKVDPTSRKVRESSIEIENEKAINIPEEEPKILRR